MDNKAATLMIRYRDDAGTWRRSLAATAGNGRVRAGYALVDGHPVQCAKYVYQVRFYVDGQATYESVGANATEAEAKRKLLQQQRRIKAEAPAANLTIVEGPERKTLQATAAAYVKVKIDGGFTEAAEQARLVTTEFMATTKKRFIDELKSEDITRYHNSLRKIGRGNRTVANKHQRLVSWLHFAGIQGEEVPAKPRYELALPTIYTPDQISTLLADDNEYTHMVALMALKLGLRDQELRHAEFTDIDMHDKLFRVQGKPQYKFTVKDWEQRDIPIPDDLIDELKTWKKASKGRNLILATRNDKPNTKMLLAIKGLARRSKLNCGHCDACKARRECEEFELHKFRRTYITTLLRSGIDLRTVQAYAGHKDLASTMRYLRPAAGEEARKKVNAVRWDR
jgi:integrase